VSAVEAPVVVRYVPAPQSLHPEEPGASLYLPAAHAEHVPPSAPVYPAWHRQLLRRILPVGDWEFGGQGVHVSTTEAPVAVEYVFAPQPVQVLSTEAPAVVEYVPAPQSVQVLAVEAPVAVRYFPAPQSVHAAEPSNSLYFPAAHAEHVPPSAPVYPALHRQLLESPLPRTEIECSGQVLQGAEPELGLYFPATHSSQVCPSSPVAPALQVQSVRRADPAGEFEFTGQTSQVGLPSADHEPAEHCWHVSAPVAPTAAE
jgi:hypothetical protein